MKRDIVIKVQTYNLFSRARGKAHAKIRLFPRNEAVVGEFCLEIKKSLPPSF